MRALEEINGKLFFFKKIKKHIRWECLKWRKNKDKNKNKNKRFFFKNVKKIQKIKIELCFKCRKKEKKEKTKIKENNIG